MVTFSAEQERALDAVGKFLKSKDWAFVLTGAAGCGKSTLAQRINGDGVLYCSPTGKGADALRKRSKVQASTVHKVLYKPKEKGKGRIAELTERILKEEKSKAPDLKIITDLSRELRDERKRIRTPSWSVPPDAECKAAKLLVVDECFMLNAQVIGDLRQNTKKVLFLGDPYQLPPVAGDCPLSSQKADSHLTEVHRQALENPILYAATEIRQGRAIPRATVKNEHGSYQWLKKSETGWDHYRDVEQIIVAKNATRRKFNDHYRARIGFKPGMTVGDRIIFLKNDHDIGIYNGSVGVLNEFHAVDFEDSRGQRHPNCYEITVTLDDGRIVPAVPVWDGALRGEHTADGPREVNAIDYAYALTGHKAQGSEYDSTLVYDEGFGDMPTWRRWIYTTITRARNACTVVGTK